MPNLVYRRPGQPKFSTFPLYKPVTSIGRDPDNDLVIDDGDLRASHALIHFDGSAFTLQAVDRHSLIQQSGKRVKKKVLSHGDEFKMGRTTLSFILVDEPRRRRSRDPDESAARRLHELRKLHQFSKQLLGQYELNPLVEQLLDSTIDVTGADKGILVLVDGDGLAKVQAARDARRASLPASDSLVSDAIVSKVMRTKAPLIVSDAQGDSEDDTEDAEAAPEQSQEDTQDASQAQVSADDMADVELG
ncbi:MAG: FHA domain-containing protein, partial [Myxococcota bacterium]